LCTAHNVRASIEANIDRMKKLLLGGMLWAALALGVAPAHAADPPPNPPRAQTLTVFAAASLHNAFADLATTFESSHPGVTVRLNFDGSQILETQIANGAPADVFASADQRSMEKAASAGLTDAPAVFARNSLVAIAQFDTGVRSLRDLTRDGLKLAICAEQVPCGRYTRIALRKMSADKSFWPKYGDQVLRNVATQEQNVEGVVQKVMLGEADAGLAYATDVIQKDGVRLASVPVPDEDQEIATYPIAVVKDAPNGKLARSFIDFVMSADGQRVLLTYGFRGKS
jgi:molybdate transport system substrate-binding protein